MAEMPKFEINYERMWGELIDEIEDLGDDYALRPPMVVETMKRVRDRHIRKNNQDVIQALAEL